MRLFEIHSEYEMFYYIAKKTWEFAKTYNKSMADVVKPVANGFLYRLIQGVWNKLWSSPEELAYTMQLNTYDRENYMALYDWFHKQEGKLI